MTENNKNITPNRLAVTTAFLCALATLGGLLLLHYLLPTLPVVAILLGCLLCFVVCYVLFYGALERFIYRRIKLIYKIIHRLKKPIGYIPEKPNMNRNVLEDVTMEVMEWAEQQSTEIEQLKKLEAYRREFLGNVSHELKTPLFNMQGYLDTLIEGGIDDSRINREYLHRAAKNVERLINIVNDLDIISRHESGELELNWERFKIYDLAREVMDSFEMLADANDISIVFKDGCSTSIVVLADKEKIRQVFNNLISNSIKYGKENGKTSIGIYDMDNLALIEVTDDGIGIEAKHIPRLFERFYRIDPSRSRMLGGSGLGLAIVKHIVEAHGQNIHARSTPGVGTTFGFTLQKA